MWRRLEEAAKQATANATEMVNAAHEKAQVLAASVREDAAALLQAIGTIRPGPVDEILYEEIEAYKVFVEGFQIDTHTDEISQILEEDDEIRGLHEEMVPVQLSYEEFWCRYFFRREQEQARLREEEERKKREEDEAAAELKMLESFDLSDDDEKDDKDANEDTLEDGKVHEEDTDEAREAAREAMLKLQSDLRATRKVAKQWKQKAIEFQKQLGILAAKHAEEKEDMQQTMESKFQSLSDSYENKITEATLQIDEARAAGFDAGIQESEAIVASVKEQAEVEIAQLKSLLMEVEKRNQNDPTPRDVSGGSATADLEQQLDEAKKETNLWKARAMKMKKLKEQLESGETISTDQSSVALKTENERLAKELAAANNKCNEIKESSYAEGVAAGRAELESATAALKKEVESLRLELQTLRAASSVAGSAIPSAGDVLAQADAVLSSVEADPLALGADATTVPSATRDDWGEW